MGMREVWAGLPVLLWSGVVLAQVEVQDGAYVTACETLLAVRRIGAVSRPAPEPVVEPGCRRIARSDIRTVERRAVIGGMPYECLAAAGAAQCVWVVP